MIKRFGFKWFSIWRNEKPAMFDPYYQEIKIGFNLFWFVRYIVFYAPPIT